MTDYKCVKVMRALGAYEQPVQALFVGGCVRNTLMGRPVNDIDIATIHHPLHVIEKLKSAGIRYVPTGLDHGTVTAIVDGTTFEITTLRKDIETDGRHAVISFSEDWGVDASRRDFTINTLLASPEGLIFDPTGSGLSDVEARRVTFVGNAAERVAEDYLRIFRFFRFYAQYGDGAPDPEAMAACKLHAPKIPALSKERIGQEFLKILDVPDPSNILEMMVENDITPCLRPTYKTHMLKLLCEFQLRHDAKDLMARLFAIAGMKPNYFEDQIVLSNAQKKSLEIMGQGLAILKRVGKKKMRELVYRVGNQMALQIYLLKLTQNDDLPDFELLDLARYWQAPEFPVKAEELIGAGISRGPELGKKLKELEEKWVTKDFPTAFSYKK